jgi:hypothetical protein
MSGYRHPLDLQRFRGICLCSCRLQHEHLTLNVGYAPRSSGKIQDMQQNSNLPGIVYARNMSIGTDTV